MRAAPFPGSATRARAIAPLGAGPRRYASHIRPTSTRAAARRSGSGPPSHAGRLFSARTPSGQSAARLAGAVRCGSSRASARPIRSGSPVYSQMCCQSLAMSTRLRAARTRPVASGNPGGCSRAASRKAATTTSLKTGPCGIDGPPPLADQRPLPRRTSRHGIARPSRNATLCGSSCSIGTSRRGCYYCTLQCSALTIGESQIAQESHRLREFEGDRGQGCPAANTGCAARA
jgi:hypothetical protein